MRTHRQLQLTGLVMVPVLLTAQVPGRVLDLQLEKEVSGADLDLVRIAGAFVGTDGSLVVGDADGLRVLIFAPGGEVRTVGREGEGPGEFKHIRRVGPTPEGGFWVADMSLLRAQIFDFDGKLHITIPLSMYTTMPPSTRLFTYPVAYLGEKRLLLSAASTLDSMALMTVDIRKGQPHPVVWLHKGACRTDNANVALTVAPFCTDEKSAVSPNGMTAFIVTDSSGSDPMAKVVVTIANTTDSQPPRNIMVILGRRRRVQSWELDSLKAEWSRALARQLPAAAEKFRTDFDKLDIPAFHPGFDDLMVSSEGTIWIGSPTDQGRTWVLMDSLGTVRGHVELPMSELPTAASGSVVWTTRPDPNGFLNLRRYQFQ